jgi:phosphoglucosamine mutase|tara:strand:- start:539 stop:1921 length:1383 start_codon:yes stop_codon:yes gene_type:complete
VKLVVKLDVKMKRGLFGTDGIRGKSNVEPMTAATALGVAMAAGKYFSKGEHRQLAIIGKDTRLSNYMLEPAMQSGFISVGMDVVLVGPMPTPAVAMLTRSLRADVGVMISASHNPFEDNGIKLFGPDGYKLSDSVEEEIEQLLKSEHGQQLAGPANIGRARRLEDASGRYIEFIKHTFPRGLSLDGLKVVIDCAHGAAYRVAPQVLHELGAEVIPIAIEPNGLNINENSGATATTSMQNMVRECKAHLGFALDGDADRLIVSDENGALLDGDQVMALIATKWHKSGTLNGGGVVATVMSNMGLDEYFKKIGLELIRTQVGDRYVLDHMRKNGYNVGGEQSGHIVLSDYSTTGDGLIAALQVAAIAVESGDPLSKIGHVFKPYPQVLKNVVVSGSKVLDDEEVQKLINQKEFILGKEGRLLIRPSGTEPVIRIMAEGKEKSKIELIVDDIVEILERNAIKN